LTKFRIDWRPYGRRDFAVPSGIPRIPAHPGGEQSRIELDRAELRTQILNRSRSRLAIDGNVARTIDDADAQTQLIRAHAFQDAFAVAPITQARELLKEALPRVVRNPTGSRPGETLERETQVQADTATRGMRWDWRRHLRYRDLQLRHATRVMFHN
jgi:hypothetical protein